jgi:hypothetical protein
MSICTTRFKTYDGIVKVGETMTQPTRRFQAGACSASIFANEIHDGANGRHFYSVSLQRFYKDKIGGFRYTASLVKGGAKLDHFGGAKLDQLEMEPRFCFEFLWDGWNVA